jgi:hypothetical protein
MNHVGMEWSNTINRYNTVFYGPRLDNQFGAVPARRLELEGRNKNATVKKVRHQQAD